MDKGSSVRIRSATTLTTSIVVPTGRVKATSPVTLMGSSVLVSSAELEARVESMYGSNALMRLIVAVAAAFASGLRAGQVLKHCSSQYLDRNRGSMGKDRDQRKETYSGPCAELRGRLHVDVLVDKGAPVNWKTSPLMSRPADHDTLPTTAVVGTSKL